jgi:hypothetical protein
LVNLGVSAKKPTPESVAGTGLEVLLLDGKAGTLVTLINWSETSRKDRRGFVFVYRSHRRPPRR